MTIILFSKKTTEAKTKESKITTNILEKILAILIPPLNSRDTKRKHGEKRFAERLDQKLTDECLCWRDISIGEKTRYPDFVICHPERGILVLEVKDWGVMTIININKEKADILTEQGIKKVSNPLEQARQGMVEITRILERDPQLISSDGKWQGKLLFPYAHGVVFPNITRAQFNSVKLGAVIPEHLVLCKDEMTESVDADVFQERLWSMFPVRFERSLLPSHIDRIRWHLFPEIRLSAQQDLFSTEGQNKVEMPDLLRVMDIQQEQLARGLGEGHRVIHGVAGSGKTLILGYRAEYLAKISQRPILVLCYNKTLATKLAELIAAKNLQDKIHVVNFHAWCSRQLNEFQVEKPAIENKTRDVYFEDCVNHVIHSVEQKLIPSAQYDAVLIDEGHDFKPEWLRLAVQMLHPDSNSLLVLYDDAQSIYGGAKKLKFSFSSVGVQAKGRTTILKLNYRNTVEVLLVASAFADELLNLKETEEDQAPTLLPMSAGRRGAKPLFVARPGFKEEAEFIVDRLIEANEAGTTWNEMAIIYRRYGVGKQMTEVLKRKEIPFQWQQDSKHSFSPSHDSVKLITMHSSKGLEFPLVCIPGVGALPIEEDDFQEEARLLYVAMTRATSDLVMTHSESSYIVEKMQKAMGVLQDL